MQAPVEPCRHRPGARRQQLLVLVSVLVTAGLVAALVAGASSPTLDLAPRPAAEPSTGVATTLSPERTPSAAASAQAPASHPDDAVLTLSAPSPALQSGAGLTREEDAVTTAPQKDDAPPDSTPVAASDSGPREADAPSTERQVYTWRDGDVTRRVWVEVEKTAPQGSEAALRDAVIPSEDDRTLPKDGADLVFHSESSGTPMTLPGGVVLVLDPEWTDDEVKSFFSSNGIAESSVSDLGYLPKGFLVETAPGLPSLNLANALATQEGVVLSTPNWLRGVSTR